MTREARSIRCPEGVLGWIPWYGEEGENGLGVLTDRQRGAVEAHCAECADCRAELDMISGAPYEIDVDLPDSERLFEEITARIEAGEAAAPETEMPSSVIPIGRARKLDDADYGKLAHWLAASDDADLEASADSPAEESPPNVISGPWGQSKAWAAAAAVLLFALGGLGGTLFSQSAGTASPDVYTLATAETPVALATAAPHLVAAPQIDVIFKDTASARQISQTLRGLGLEIVSGPASNGVYRLQMIRPLAGGTNDAAAPGDSQAAALAAQLRAADDQLATYVEPVR